MGVERPEPAALRTVADWLDACVQCEQIHVQHPEPRTGIRGETIVYQSWAGEDGHPYRRRSMTVPSLNEVGAMLRLAAETGG